MKLGGGLPTVGVSGWRRFFARFDWPLFLITIVISGIGLLNLYSATHGTVHSAKFREQLVWMVIGLTVYFAASAIDYRFLIRLAWIGLGIAIAGVVAVGLLGHSSNGAQRWLDLGLFRVQPSELAKIAVIVALARLAQDRSAGELTAAEASWRVVVILVPIGLIAWQPDLGSAALLALIILSIACLILPKVWPLLTGLILFCLKAAPHVWHHLLHYQKERWVAFLDPSADPTGAGWHTQQSIFAVGSGRLTGKGFLNATQNQFNFLPEHWTDFPYSVWAEEWGFIGSVVLLALLFALMLWIVNIALNARDEFGSVICIGVGAMLFWHVTVNIAMVLGLAPVVGVTLPLISYGGSSLVTIFLGLGLVSSVSARRHGF